MFIMMMIIFDICTEMMKSFDDQGDQEAKEGSAVEEKPHKTHGQEIPVTINLILEKRPTNTQIHKYTNTKSLTSYLVCCPLSIVYDNSEKQRI